MSLTPDRFDEFFHAVYEKDPFPWQSRMARELAGGDWPDCIDLPTASGKTSLIDIAVFTLACQASLPVDQRSIGRRIFFTVNRRVIVDEAHTHSISLAKSLLSEKDGIINEVADALRSIGGETDIPLDVAQLRGGIYRDVSWARSITQPMVVCTTADQLGSRILFRGYGVSSRMQPIHAALTACDSVLLLDEAHVTKAFSQTLRLIQKYQQHKPGLRFVEMTATPTNETTKRFTLSDEDRSHPVLQERQNASKPAELLLEKPKAFVPAIAKWAKDSVNDQRKAIGIIVNRVQTARDVYDVLNNQFPGDTHLVIGRMRPLDRDELQKKLRELVGPARPKVLEKPVFIVATQCLEVGADYDFDALITECASIDALRQRFGRLNRKGRDIEAKAAIITSEAAIKEDDDPVYGQSLKKTWEWLTESDRKSVDFGITSFAALWENVDREKADSLTNITPDAAVLLPAHLDALCQTNPQPVPSPDVSYFIHGPQRDNLEVNVCWRSDLGTDQTLWAEIVAMIPPTSPECMTVPLRVVRQWMLNVAPPIDADIPVKDTSDTPKSATPPQTVLRWRGADDAIPINNPNDLRPGDTIVIPAPIAPTSSDANALGHIPASETGYVFDLAEQACAVARRQRIIRVHPDVHPELHTILKKYIAEEEQLTKGSIREKLGTLSAGFTNGPDEIPYPSTNDQNPPGIVLRFKGLLPKTHDWKPTVIFEDGDDDSSSESQEPVSLSRHVQDVVRYTTANVEKAGLTSLVSLFETAAKHHDNGKADRRFTALLAGVSPYEVFERPPLAKSGDGRLSHAERLVRSKRAMLPPGFRHEMLSLQIVEHFYDHLINDPTIDRELLLHLIAAHHGHARPFAPVVIDATNDETRSVDLSDLTISISPQQRREWIEPHRLDSGVAERFWDLTRKHGWWGLAWYEAILRLADCQASEMEQKGASK